MKNLQRAAQSRGQEVEAFVREWAQSVNDDPAHDPFWQAAGCVDSGTPDLAERHDFYLAEEMMNTHADQAGFERLVK